MASLQSLHAVHVLQDSDKFTNSKGVHLGETHTQKKAENLFPQLDLTGVPLAGAHLGEGPGVESPADVVAVLDSDVSSVSDSVNRPDPANVLQTQIDCFTLALLLHGHDLTLPPAAVI